MLRLQLINEYLGSQMLEMADPIDIHSLGQILKRGKENGGVFYEIIVDVEFLKDGRAFIQKAYELHGRIDAKVIVNVYDYDTNNYVWELFGTGQINYNSYDIGEFNVIVTIEQTGIQRRVLNMMNQSVALESATVENGSSPFPIPTIQTSTWHSQKLVKQSKMSPGSSAEFQQLDVFLFAPLDDEAFDAIIYIQLDNSKREMEELKTVFETPYGMTQLDTLPSQAFPGSGSDLEYAEFLTDNGLNKRNPIHEAEEAGVMNVNFVLRHKFKVVATNLSGDVDVNGTDGCLGHIEMTAWYEHRDKNGNLKSLLKLGTWNVIKDGNTGESLFETKNFALEDIEVEIGDRFYVYGVMRIYGNYDGPGVVGHDIYVTADHTITEFEFEATTIAPETEVASVMIYEAFEQCLKFITNRDDAFYSTLLGKVENGYDEDGEFSMLAWLNGRWLRGRYQPLSLELDRKERLYTTLKELIDFVNSIASIEFGFEIIDGVEKFVIEKKAYFYRKDIKILSLGSLYNVRKKVISDKYYNLFKYGYEGKLDISQANARDAFNTFKKLRIPLINTKNELVASTKVRTSGELIEHQRRMAFSTEDSNLDDDKFCVAMLRDGEGFKPKKNEGYEEINNYIDGETGYNYDLQPARIAKNWYEVLASCMIGQPSKVLRFGGGEYNYRYSSRKTSEAVVVAEDADVDLTFIEPIWDNELYSFEAPMSREEMKLLLANPKGYIEGVDETGATIEGFISDEGIEYISEQKKAVFKLLKVYRPAQLNV